jgi:hypothetical protein
MTSSASASSLSGTVLFGVLFEELRRLAIQPVSQIFDCLHVARFAAAA